MILHAPMSFFDTTPIGRIVNRFSKGNCLTQIFRLDTLLKILTFVADIYTLDEQLMMALRSYLSTVMSVCSTIVLISAVTPYFTICLVPMIIYYGYQQNFFTVSSPTDSLPNTILTTRPERAFLSQ